MRPITRVAKEKNEGGKEKKREENNILSVIRMLATRELLNISSGIKGNANKI